MLVEKTQIMDQKAMSRAITRISFEIIERNKGAGNLYIIGIMTRGAELAQRVAKKISELERSSVQVGYLDVTAYRDDKRSGTSGEDRPTCRFPSRASRLSWWTTSSIPGAPSARRWTPSCSGGGPAASSWQL